MLKQLPKKKILLLLGDIVLFALIYFISPYIRFGSGMEAYIAPSWAGAFVFTFIYVIVFYLMDLYDYYLPFSSARYLFRYLIGFMLASALVVAGFYFLPWVKIGRFVFLISALLTIITTYSYRIFLEWLFSSFFEMPRKILIVGAGLQGRAVYDLIKDDKGFNIAGFIDDESAGETNANISILGGFELLDLMVIDHEVDAVIITTTSPDDPVFLKCVLDAKMSGVEVYDMPLFYEELTGKIPVEHINDMWFINASIHGVSKSFYNHRVKRFLDITISLVCLLLSLPVIIVTAILISVESRGSILYKQKRVGLYGEVFEILKFRSMHRDAEASGAKWAEKNDPRITRYGRIIRRFRIDELPQVWNVLKGEMSFIGPRPERPEFVMGLREKIPYYALRDSVKPGITGWAQVNFPYGSSEEDALKKLQYDFFYIKNLSPVLDFLILMRTLKVLIYRTGAR